MHVRGIKVRRQTALRSLSAGFAAVLIAVGLVACSAGTGDTGVDPEVDGDATPSDSPDDSDSGDTEAADADDGSDVGELVDPAEDVDYSEDAGSDLETHEYPDDPEPAEGIVATLCNLNQAYFTSLRAESDDGMPIVDDALRLSVLSVDDNLSLWDSIRPHYPESENAIDTAWLIRNSWDEALLHGENGDDADALEAMAEAEEEIQNLPAESGGSDVDCQ